MHQGESQRIDPKGGSSVVVPCGWFYVDSLGSFAYLYVLIFCNSHRLFCKKVGHAETMQEFYFQFTRIINTIKK